MLGISVSTSPIKPTVSNVIEKIYFYRKTYSYHLANVENALNKCLSILLNLLRQKIECISMLVPSLNFQNKLHRNIEKKGRESFNKHQLCNLL